MPIFASTTGVRVYGRLSGPTLGAHWLALYGNYSAASSDYSYDIAYDSSGNVYVVGFSFINSNNQITLIKYNSYGVLQWQRLLNTSGSDQGISVAVSSSGDVLITGSIDSSLILAKYSSDGVIQWQRALSSSFGQGVAVDASNNIYVTGGTNNKVLVAKYNSTGDLQWQRDFGTSGFDGAQEVATDSSGNVYVGARIYNPATGYTMSVLKYNSSGTLQWQRMLTNAAGSVFGNDMAVDASGNVYLSGNFSSTRYVAKYDTSGTLQWQRKLDTANSDTGTGIDVNSSGDVFSSGQGENGHLIAKYNSSGSLQWQRKLSSSAGQAWGLKTDSAGSIYLTATVQFAGGNDVLTIKLPDDGTKTGTYSIGANSITYSTSNATDSAGDLVSEISTWSGGTPTLTSSISTASDSQATLTSTTVNF